MSLPRYAEYKDSGIEWLGTIPKGWGISRLGFECETVVPMRDKPELLEGPIPWIRIEDFVGKYIAVSKSSQGVTKETMLAMGLKVFPVGAVLCSCSCSMGATAIVQSPLVSNQTFIGIIPFSGYSSEYLYYFFLAAAPYLNSIGTGAIQTYLSRDDFRQLRLPCPSVKEQTAIATFLDREIAKIDALIAEQEKLIALLAEKRQATISHAVTKGLNPNAPMKDSGVAWLGEVPAHWGVGALSYLATIDTGSTPDRGNESYWNGNIPWIKTGEINWDSIKEAEEFITQEGMTNSAVKLARPGTLLMAMYGQGVTRGRVALLEINATYNQACAAISFELRIRPEFGRYFFMAAYHYIRDNGNETSQMNLSAGAIGKIKLAIPSQEEQSQIIYLLDLEMAKIERLNIQARQAITLLKERRSALITAAVTGQIDVRNVVVQEIPA